MQVTVGGEHSRPDRAGDRMLRPPPRRRDPEGGRINRANSAVPDACEGNGERTGLDEGRAAGSSSRPLVQWRWPSQRALPILMPPS